MPLALVAAAMGLVEYAWQTMTTVYPLWMHATFGYGSLALGLILLGSGIVLILVQGTIHGLIVTAKLGKHAASAVGALLLGLGLLTYPRVTLLGPHFVLFTVQVVGYSIEQGALPSTLSRYAGKARQGRALGVGQAAKSAGRVVGPLVAGSVYAQDGPVFVLAGGAALLACVLVLVLLLGNRRAHAREVRAEDAVITAVPPIACPHFGDGAVGEPLLRELLRRARGAGCPLVAGAYEGDAAAAAKLRAALAQVDKLAQVDAAALALAHVDATPGCPIKAAALQAGCPHFSGATAA